MGLIDIIVMVLVVAAVASRFMKFKLPKDPRDSAARKAEYDRMRGRPLMRDDAPAQAPGMVDVTPVAEARSMPRKPSQKDLFEAAKNLTGMAKLKMLDPGFDEAAFLEGAKGAYSYFYASWNSRDEEGLDNLCAPGLYGRLLTELHDDKVWHPVEVDEVTAAKVAGVRINGKTAIVDVDFEALERESGGVAKVVRRRWVLARPIGSEDPNWELQDITTQVDA